MLRSLNKFYGDRLGASDGEIGRVKDFYFDDQQWALRYVVADTGAWLPGRLVLISPHAFGNFYEDGHSLLVKLTRQQIEDSPPIEEHEPVSRQYEKEYHRYYGWPAYWDGVEMSEAAEFPGTVPEPESNLMPTASVNDPHLRSTKAMTGYHIQTHDGAIGHVIDFMIDDESWLICRLVVETGHWFAGKEIALLPTQVERISYEESKIFVNVTKDSLLKASEYRMPPAIYHDSHNFDD